MKATSRWSEIVKTAEAGLQSQNAHNTASCHKLTPFTGVARN